MASKEFLESMLKGVNQIFLKFDLLQLNEQTMKFEVIDTSIVEERKLPNGVSCVNGSISINTEQDIRTTLDLEITNHDGMNNWGADGTVSSFKWWLDKRIVLHLGLMLDGGIEYVQMGYFLITHFKSNHSLTTYPVLQIQGSSKESLFATRRGKFLFGTTIAKNSVMVNSIKTLLTGGGELESKIMIDPQIADKAVLLEDGESLNEWTYTRADVQIGLDTVDFAHGKSSLKLTVDKATQGVIAEKTFDFPVDLTGTNAIALWTRCSKDVTEGEFALRLINKDGVTTELPMRALVGHIIEGDTVTYIDNWRNNVLSTDGFDKMNKVVSIQIVSYAKGIQAPYELWIDQLYCAEVNNLLPYDLTYGAGNNRWAAISDIADLLDCNCYYDEYGNFRLDKRKFPKEMNTKAEFEYDAYNVLEPVITFNDQQEFNNLYAGTEDLFEEHELSNHINVVGGSTSSAITQIADMELKIDGLHIREKGKTLNGRGMVRAIDQFAEGSKPTVLNGSTNVEEVYKHHKNLEAVVKEYPNGFIHLETPPISNFATQRIGDYIYHHNNASPDPVIEFTYEAKNRALYELRKRMSYSEQLSISAAPFFTLRGNDIIRIEDSLLNNYENYEVKSITIPLNGSYLSISAVKIKNLLNDIPYFDISGIRANQSYYNYNGCGLAFTYPLREMEL